MATTKTFYVTKDARVAERQSDGWDAGSGASDGLPFGAYGDYFYRSLLGFSINMAGWTSITAASIHYKTSNQIHIGFGSDPTCVWRRITSNWSEGSSNGLSGSNSVIYPGPSTSDTNMVTDDLPNGESTWGSASILAMMRDVLAGSAFYGLSMRAPDTSATHVGEIFSREYGASAYITITYETNAPPTTAIAVAGLSGGIVSDTTPDITLTMTDPQDDDIAQYQWQLDDNSDFSSPIEDHTVAGPLASPAVVVVTPAALTPGTTYYVRARSADATGFGAWSATTTLKVASAPTLTVTEPSASGRLGKTSYDLGSGWVSPRLNVAWTFVCPDGGTQDTATVDLAADAAGSPGTVLHTVTDTDTATRAKVLAYDLTEGSYYHVRVSVTCSHGLTTVLAYRRIRVRWGMVTHRFDMGAAPSSLALSVLDVTDSTTGGAGKVAVEFATTAAVGAPAAYFGTIGGAGLNRYLWYRTWLLLWGASPATSPLLNELKVTYDAVQIVPDKWTRSDVGNQAGDVAAYVYGTKSFRMSGKGSSHHASQQIPVAPNTWYTLSGRIQSLGNSGAYAAIASAADSGDLVATPAKTGTVGFEEDVSRVKTAAWFSGSNTSAYVRLVVSGAVGTTAWFDAMKVEASTVVTPWSPGYIANAVVLDSGGLQIDAANGGIFRLRGSSGGARDEVTLSAHGLTFGGDVEVDSPSAGILRVGGASGAPIAGKPPIRRVYTAGATWTKPAGLSHIEVEVVGGGGGSGGCATGTTGGAVGGGGGGGGYARKLFTAADLAGAATFAVAVGAAGTAGAGSTAVAGTGGTSSFSGTGITTVQGLGGEGGTGSASTTGTTTAAPGDGGGATGGDINTNGGDGSWGEVASNTRILTGLGGSSVLGGGSRVGSGVGVVGGQYGGGGGGASDAGGTARVGGAGGAGVVIVTEYYAP